MPQALMPIILLLILISILFGYKKAKMYFLWIECTKGYKPLKLSNKLLLVTSIILPLIHNSAINSKSLTTVDVILFVLPLGIMVVCNFVIKDIKHIIFVTILQLLMGIASIFISIVALVVIGFTSGSYTETKKASQEYDSRMAMIKASWLGKELDYTRASQLGFSSPEEAMEQGYMYNGNRIFDSKIS